MRPVTIAIRAPPHFTRKRARLPVEDDNCRKQVSITVPVTTKHEKAAPINRPVSISCGSFQGSSYHNRSWQKTTGMRCLLPSKQNVVAGRAHEEQHGERQPEIQACTQ